MDSSYDYVSLTICILVLPLNVILNGGVLIASCKQRILRKKRFGILISLAFADLLRVIHLTSEIVTLFQNEDEGGEFCSCLILSTVGLYLICVTILHLVLESINRLIAIARPLRYNDILTTKIFMFLMVLVWLLPVFGIVLTHAVFKKQRDWIPSFRVLMFNCDSSIWHFPSVHNESVFAKEIFKKRETREKDLLVPTNISIQVYSAIVTLVYFVLPWIIMLVCYSIIFKISLKHIQQIKSLEKNIRHLYHRMSRSRMQGSFGFDAGYSSTSSVTTTESVSTKFYPLKRSGSSLSSKKQAGERRKSAKSDGRESKSAKSCDTVGHDVSIGGLILEDFNPQSVVMSIPNQKHEIKNNDGRSCIALEEKLSSSVTDEKDKYCCEKRANKSTAVLGTEAMNANDYRPKNDSRTSISKKPKRKHSNVVYPQDTYVEDEKINRQYMQSSKSHWSPVDWGESADISEMRRTSVQPLHAADVMARGYDDILSSEICYTGKIKPVEKEPLKKEDSTGSSAATEKSEAERFAACTGNLDGNDNVNDEVFLEDYVSQSEIPPKGVKFQHSHPTGVSAKKRLWPKIWHKRPAGDDESEDRVPSEAAFLKIIDKLERKSKPSPKTFEKKARGIMRFSLIIKSHGTKGSIGDDEMIERPTQEEFDRLETLFSRAGGTHVTMIDKDIETTDTQAVESLHEGASVDLFGMMTGLPVLEAWADSLKAKAVMPSNSFVRFYRVIRGEMRSRKQEGKLVKTLGGLFAAWIIFYVPILVLTWRRLSNWPNGAGEEFDIGKFFLSWALLSSALNPVIYCLRIPEFKKAFSKLICSCMSNS